MNETKTASKTIEQLQKENDILRAKLSTATIKKEFSDYFRNKDSETAKVYKNISETAKHIESKHSDILDAMKKENSDNLLTVTTFNDKVATALKRMYDL